MDLKAASIDCHLTAGNIAALTLSEPENQSSQSDRNLAGLVSFLENALRSSPLMLAYEQSVQGRKRAHLHFKADRALSGRDLEWLRNKIADYCDEEQRLGTEPTVPSGEIQELPIDYALGYQFDLLDLAETLNLSSEALIKLHGETVFTVGLGGFSPGFFYLEGLPERLAVPRLPSARASVPAGAVAIANRQCCVYPFCGAGGWNIIGRCPLPLLSCTMEGEPKTRLKSGMKVRFVDSSKKSFVEAQDTGAS